MRSMVFALALIGGLAAGPAMASQCPALMAEIDSALSSAEVSDADKAKVMQLRAEGEALHKAGDHAGSVAALNEAKAILEGN